MKSVAIIGSSVEGLLVAHAADWYGYDFRIYSNTLMQADIALFDYLDVAINSVTESIPSVIQVNFEGTQDEWTEKAGYPPVLPIDSQRTYGFNLQMAYEELWVRYGYLVQPWEPQIDRFAAFDLVVSTVPRPMWGGSAQFGSATVYQSTEAPFGPKEDNTVIYDSDLDVGFCRMAQLFGRSVVEWPESRKPPIPGLKPVQIPTRVTGVLPASQFTHLGRYAQWRNEVTPSDVYRAAAKLFSKPEPSSESDDELWETNPYAPPKD